MCMLSLCLGSELHAPPVGPNASFIREECAFLVRRNERRLVVNPEPHMFNRRQYVRWFTGLHKDALGPSNAQANQMRHNAVVHEEEIELESLVEPSRESQGDDRFGGSPLPFPACPASVHNSLNFIKNVLAATGCLQEIKHPFSRCVPKSNV